MTKKITKRLFTLLLAATLVFPLISCGGKAPEVNDPEPNTPVVSTPPETPVTVAPPAETPIPPEPIEPKTWSGFEVNFFIYKSEPYEAPYASAQVCSSKEELLPLYEGLDEKETATLQEGLAKYDDAYFENHTLIWVSFVCPSSSHFVFMDSIELRREQDETAIHFIDAVMRDNGKWPDTQVYYCIILTTEEDIDIDSSEKIEVYFRETKFS